MKNKCLLAALCLLVGCAIPYLTILQNDFIYTWDDDVYVVDNPILKTLSYENLKAIFTTEIGANYHPVTHLSLALEYQLFDGAAWGFHLVSLLFHLANVVLVFYLTYLLFNKNLWAGIAAGFIFGLHPMHVESVAWVSERKDVLFLFFLLGGLITYHFYIYRKRSLFFIVTCLLAILSMLSKPAAVVFPALLLLIDWWYKRPLNLKLCLEKIPFALMSIGLIVLTLYAQSQYEALNKIHIYTLSERLIFGAYVWLMYLVKFFVPINLSGFYPYPPVGAPLPFVIQVAPLLVLLLSGGLVWWGKSNRLVGFSMLFFTVSLLPVLQIIPVGSSIISERYTYLPYVGLGFGITTLFTHLKNKYKNYIPTQVSILTALGIISAVSTWQRCQVWENDLTFWSDTVKKQPLAINAYHGMGTYFYERQEYEKSLEQYDLALAIHPEYADAIIGKALTLYELGDFKKAKSYFSQAIDHTPEDAYLRMLRGECLVRVGEYELALSDFDACIKMDLQIPELYKNRAFIYAMNKDYDTAQKDWEKAVELGTRDASVFYNLGTHYYEKGETEKAIKYLQTASKFAPEESKYRSALDKIEM